MIPSLVLIGVFVISSALIFICVGALKLWHKRDARRSPLHGKKLANLPGQQLLKRVNDHGDELLLAGTMYISFSFMLLAWVVIRVPWDAAHF